MKITTHENNVESVDLVGQESIQRVFDRENRCRESRERAFQIVGWTAHFQRPDFRSQPPRWSWTAARRAGCPAGRRSVCICAAFSEPLKPRPILGSLLAAFEPCAAGRCRMSTCAQENVDSYAATRVVKQPVRLIRRAMRSLTCKCLSA